MEAAAAPKPTLIVMPGQEIEPWVQRIDDKTLQLAFDSGDNGFLVLTNEQFQLPWRFPAMLPWT